MQTLLLTYADRHSDLPSIRRESERVQQHLRPGADKNCYQLIPQQRATLDSLVRELTHSQEALFAFSYSGHAGDAVLDLEERAGNSLGVAQLLARCPQLQLVVLNGCSTYAQVRQLREAGVRAVIVATYAPVGDDAAAFFAATFFQALAQQRSVAEAFKSGVGAAQTSTNRKISVTRDVNWEGVTASGPLWALAEHEPGQAATLTLPNISRVFQTITIQRAKEINAVPTRDPASLIGRATFLQQLRENLVENKQIVLVNAMGGVGKTAIAEAYTAQYYDDYERIVWIQQTEEEDLRLAFTNNRQLLDYFELTTAGKDIDTLFAQVCAQLNGIEAQPKLLVLDNVTQAAYEHWNLLPKPPNWHVLYTSREKLREVRDMELDFLSEEEAIELFEFYYGEPVDHEQLRTIIELFDRHTLTIEILAKAMRKNRYTLAELREALTTDLVVGDVTAHSQMTRIERVKSYLLKIFDLSTLSEHEVWLLKQFACLPAVSHSFELLADLLVDDTHDKASLSRLCTELHEKGWILYDGREADSYRMHAVIGEVLPEKSSITAAEVSVLFYRLTRTLDIDQNKDNPVDKFIWAPFGLSLLEQIDATTQDVASLQNNLALVLQDLGDYHGARDLLQKALQSNEQNYGTEHPNTARSYSNLALVLQDLGDYHGARDLLQKALQSNEQNYGTEHPNTTVSYSNLALVLKDLGDYQGARDLLQRAIQLNEQNFGHEHPATARSYSNLATVLQALGDYHGARDLLQRALQSNEQNYGTEHPNTAVSYSNLALVLKDLGDYQSAHDLLQKALLSDEQNFGSEHSIISVRYSNLATVLQALGDYNGARDLLQRALQLDEQNFGPEHPTTAVVYSNLAIVLQNLGDYHGARDLLQKAIQSDEQNYGPEHPTIARNYSNLALVLQDLGDYHGARDLLQKALRSNEQNFGPEHPATTICYSNLAMVLQDLGDYHGARDLLQKAVQSDEHNFGVEHPVTAVNYSNLALVLRDLGDYRGARDLLQRAVQSDEQNFGTEHPTTALRYYNLGAVNYFLGKRSEALDLILKAKAVFQAALPPEHPHQQLADSWEQGIRDELESGGQP